MLATDDVGADNIIRCGTPPFTITLPICCGVGFLSVTDGVAIVGDTNGLFFTWYNCPSAIFIKRILVPVEPPESADDDVEVLPAIRIVWDVPPGLCINTSLLLDEVCFTIDVFGFGAIFANVVVVGKIFVTIVLGIGLILRTFVKAVDTLSVAAGTASVVVDSGNFS